jgi:hypothetical protein
MFIGIKKWSIFHESHKSYWLIKYLNPKLISWDIINTCWTYICWSQKTIDNRKVVTRINDQTLEVNKTKRYMWRKVTFNSCVFWLSRVYANQWDAWYIHIYKHRDKTFVVRLWINPKNFKNKNSKSIFFFYYDLRTLIYHFKI